MQQRVTSAHATSDTRFKNPAFRSANIAYRLPGEPLRRGGCRLVNWPSRPPQPRPSKPLPSYLAARAGSPWAGQTQYASYGDVPPSDANSGGHAATVLAAGGCAVLSATL